MKTKRSCIATTAIVAAVCLTLAVPAFAHGARRAHRHPHKNPARFHVVVGKPRPLKHAIVIDGRPAGAIDFHVKPDDTTVSIDGVVRGTVDDYDGSPAKLRLRPGIHRLTLQTPDGDVWSKKVRVVAGNEIELRLKLDE